MAQLDREAEFSTQVDPNAANGEASASLISRRNLLTKGVAAGIGVMGLSFWEAFPAQASALNALHALTTPDQLQLVAVAKSGILWHTIRFSNSWQSSFGNVNDQESNGRSLRFTQVDCAGIDNRLHVCAVGRDRRIWHTIRFSNGSWQGSFGNVNDQESNGRSLRFQEVGCAGTSSGRLHVCGLGNDHRIWHTIRFSNGSWQSSFGNVNAQESNSSLQFRDVDCATIGEDLHVCGLDENGIIWHTIRSSNGSWQSSFGNVNDQESNGGSLRFIAVGCASIGGDLHVCAVGEDHRIWHTIRFSNGSWQSSFGDVNAQESNSGLQFRDVDCANVGNNLHVSGIARDGIVWHTIRFSNGSWQSSFGNVNAQESNSGLRFSSIGAAGVI